MKPATMSVRDASSWIGVSAGVAYEQIRQTGKLAGVEVIRVQNRILVPVAPLRRKLGIEESDDET